MQIPDYPIGDFAICVFSLYESIPIGQFRSAKLQAPKSRKTSKSNFQGKRARWPKDAISLAVKPGQPFPERAAWAGGSDYCCSAAGPAAK
jgi:hypothetical protein